MTPTALRLLKAACVVALALISSDRLLQAQLPQPVGTWAPRGAVADARIGAASVALEDGRTLIAGGRLGDGTVSDSVVIYDPVANSFAATGQLFAPRVDASAALLDDGRVVLSGGHVGTAPSADVEIFDPSTGTSAFAATMAVPRAWHASATLTDGRVLIAGGSTTDGSALATAEIFDPETSSVAPAGAMATARMGLSATTLIEGRVLIVGGNSGALDLATAEIFDPGSGDFLPVPTALGVARAGHTALRLPHNAGVLIAGGTAAGANVTAADLFLPAIFPDPYSWGMGSFAPTGALTAPRAFGAGGPAGDDGFAFVAGGGADTSEVYHFATIRTDKDDYAPGETAVITGSGWQPGEAVTLTFQEDPAVHDDYTFAVQADALGNIYWDQWAPEDHDLGVRFYLTAQGSQSRGQTTFTDAKGTSTALASGLNPSTVGQQVTFTATVTETGTGGGTAGQVVTVGTVTFREGGNNCSQGTAFASGVALSGSGTATATRTFTTTGARTIRACYQGTGGAAGTGDSSATLTQTVNPDTTAPSVTINQAAGQSDPTNSAPISFRVVFSESVSNFATGDVIVSGTANPTTAIVTGSGTTYDVAVSGMSQSGTVVASIAAGVASDTAGNPNTASTSVDNAVTYDVTAPTVTINQAAGQADPTNQSPITFTVVFSETVSNFATGDVTLSGSAGATAAVVTGSGTTYTVAVSGMSGSGTVTASLAAGVATDAAGNGNGASTSTDNTVTYDNTPPAIVSITRTTASPTNADTVAWTVTFSESVAGVETTDFVLAQTGLTGAPAIISVNGSAATYTVSASTGNGTGTLGLDVVDDDSVSDAAGNRLGGTGADNGAATGPTYSIDRTLTPIVTAENKPYDGTLAATIATRSFTSALTVTASVQVAGGTAAFEDANAGTAKTVNITGLGLTGTDAARYILSSTSATTSADITPVAATVSVLGYTGVYDAQAHGPTGSATGVGGVDLSASLTFGATFTDVPGGTAHWTFNAGGNYTTQDGDVAIVITPATAAINVAGYTGVYDAVAHGASLVAATGVGGADLSGSVTIGSDTFTNVPGGSVPWSFAHQNYVPQNGSASIEITPATATINVPGYTVEYNQQTHGLSGTATGVAGVDLSGSLTFGAALTNVPGGPISWSFAAGQNYSTADGQATVTITPRPLIVTATGVNKVYDGTLAASVTLSDDRLPGDGFAAAYAAATFTRKNAGTAIPINVTGIMLSGAAAANYAPNTSATASANISQAALTITAVTDSRVYNGTIVSVGVPVAGALFSGDTIVGLAQTYDTKAAGTGKTLSVSAYTLNDGNNGQNYAVTLMPVHTGVITQAGLSVTGITANNKPFDGNTAATLNFSGASLVGVIAPDVVTLNTSAATGTFPTSLVGGPYTVTIGGLTLGGTDAGNYAVTQPTATASITAWTLSGFLQPVGLPNTSFGAPISPTNGVWNTIKGGQTVPLKFRLFTNAGGTELTSVTDVTGFALAALPCSSGFEDPVDPDFTTSGSTALRYADGQFIVNWETPKGANRCYRVTMTARDGSQLSAFFKTK